MPRVAYGCLAAALTFALPVRAAIEINEVYFSPEQPEEGRQFIELRNTTGGATSLANLWLLEIDGDAGDVPGLQDNPGTVLSAIDLNGFSTGSNSLFLWRDSSTVLDSSPAEGVQGPGASVVHALDLFPGRVDLGFEGDEGGAAKQFENDIVNFLLVENFTGAVGFDLDSEENAIGGDGQFNLTPWTRVLDAISVKESIDPGFQYAASVAGVNVVTPFGPDILYRDPVENIWGFFDSGSGEGDSGYVGPFFANDGFGFFGTSDAAFADGRIIHVGPDSKYLYVTPGAENRTGVGGLNRGDTNHDGAVNADDIDWLFENLGVVGTSFDVALNFGAASQSDVDAIVQIVLETTFGDADLDHDVDGADFLAWQRAIGTDAGWAGGDFNGSELIDAADLAIWSANFGSAEPGPAASVPEPPASTLGLLAAVAGARAVGSRRRIARTATVQVGASLRNLTFWNLHRRSDS